MKIKDQSINAEKGRFLQSLSLPRPTIAVRYEAIPDGQRFEDADNRKIFFIQPFDFPTKYYLKNKVQSTAIELRKKDYELAGCELAKKVKLSYLKVKAEEEKLKLAENNYQLMEDFSQKAKLRYDVGEATYLEYLQAKVKKGEAQNDVIRFENELQISFADLKLLLFQDKDYETELQLSDSLTFRQINLSREILLDEVLQFNPELKLAVLKYKTSSYLKKLSYSSFLPDFTLNYFRMKIGTNRNFWGFHVEASLPVWFLFDQRGKIQEATAHNFSSLWERRNKTEELRTEMKNSILKVQSAKNQVFLYTKEILEEASEVYRMASKSYEEGEIGYLELIEAQQTHIKAKSGHIDALFNYNKALIELERVRGKELF